MLRRTIILSCMLCIVFAAVAGKKKKKAEPAAQADTENIDYKAPGAPMPFVSFYSKGKFIGKKDLENNGNLVIMMFNPTCEHCQEQTQTFEKNQDLFKKTKLVLLAAPVMSDYLDFFDNVVHYTKYPFMTVALDSSKFINKTFLYQALPQINVYNKDRRLIKVFTGEASFDSLKVYIE